jgi:hypothetical protein
MSASTVNEAIIAVLTTVGIAVAISIAFALAGALYQHSVGRGHRAVRDAAAPAQYATQTDDARELVLR